MDLITWVLVIGVVLYIACEAVIEFTPKKSLASRIANVIKLGLLLVFEAFKK